MASSPFSPRSASPSAEQYLQVNDMSQQFDEQWERDIGELNHEQLLSDMRMAEKRAVLIKEADWLPHLPINENNCADMKVLKDREAWKADIDLYSVVSPLQWPMLSRTWCQMKRTLGQFVYHCVLLRCISLYELSPPGGVLNLFTESIALDSFIRNLTYSSVMPCGNDLQLLGKMLDLLPAAELAERMEAESDEYTDMQLGLFMRSLSALRGVAAGARKRLFTAEPHVRHAFLTSGDFSRLVSRLESRCDLFIREWSSSRELSRDTFRQWSDLFRRILILSAPGYDSSLYPFLNIPSERNLGLWRESVSRRRGFQIVLEIKLSSESESCSLMLLPSNVLCYISFHVEKFLPAFWDHIQAPLSSHLRNFMFICPDDLRVYTQVEMEGSIVRFICSNLTEYRAVSFQEMRASYGFMRVFSCFNDREMSVAEKKDVYCVLAHILDQSPERILELAVDTHHLSAQEACTRILIAITLEF